MIDLGATVCTKRPPRCEECPLALHCAWRAGGCTGPDPAEGSGGTSGRQAAFPGSDREGRGRLVEALRRGPVPVAELDRAAGWPGDAGRASRVAAGLVADGLAVESGGALVLP
jgi:A/G-specific adenine glycosylase